MAPHSKESQKQGGSGEGKGGRTQSCDATRDFNWTQLLPRHGCSDSYWWHRGGSDVFSSSRGVSESAFIAPAHSALPPGGAAQQPHSMEAAD